MFQICVPVRTPDSKHITSDRRCGSMMLRGAKFPHFLVRFAACCKPVHRFRVEELGFRV